jgi:hypothetical protein
LLPAQSSRVKHGRARKIFPREIEKFAGNRFDENDYRFADAQGNNCLAAQSNGREDEGKIVGEK